MSDPLTKEERAVVDVLRSLSGPESPEKLHSVYGDVRLHQREIADVVAIIDRLTAERPLEKRERHGMIQVYSEAERPPEPAVRGGIAPDGTCVATGANEPRPPEPAEIAAARRRWTEGTEECLVCGESLGASRDRAMLFAAYAAQTRELAALRALRARLDDDMLAERIGCEHDTEDRCGCHNGGSVGIDAYRREVRGKE